MMPMWLLAGVGAVALAEEPVFSEMVVKMAPTGEVVGSGVDKYTLTVIVLNEQGAPVEGISTKVKATAGEVGDVSETSPGLYQFEWTPEVAASPTVVDLRFKGKTLDKQKIDQTWSLPVQPAYGHLVTIKADPTQLVLGRDDQASLSVGLGGGAEGARTGAELLFTVNSGEIGAPAPLGDGTYAALYTPPEADAPHLALVGVADRRAPSRTYGHLAMPLAVKHELATRTAKGCKVMVTVAGREFGPEPADSRGRATVSVVIPPGVTEATQSVLECDAAGDSSVELPVTEASRVQLLPLHTGLPADSRLQLPVRAFAVTPEGEPDSGAAVTIEASHGVVSGLSHEGGGVYAATYTPSTEGEVTGATLRATITENGEPTSVSEVPFSLVPIRPKSLTVTTTPERLAKGDTTLTASIEVTGPDGAGLAGRQLTFTAAGARLSGTPTDNGDGTYTATFSTTGRGPVDLITTVKAPAAGNQVYDIVALPTRTRLPTDGLSPATLTVLTLDEFGYPVANTDLKLELRDGDGQLPTTATTDDSGIAQVTYTAGRTPGLVHIEVAGGGVTRAVGLIQLPNSAPGVELDPAKLAPTADRATAIEQWAPIVTRVWVPRDR